MFWTVAPGQINLKCVLVDDVGEEALPLLIMLHHRRQDGYGRQWMQGLIFVRKNMGNFVFYPTTAK